MEPMEPMEPIETDVELSNHVRESNSFRRSTSRPSSAFASSTGRNPFGNTAGKDAPGVGLYSSNTTHLPARPSSAFASRTNRYTPDKLSNQGKDAPAPGSYSPADSNPRIADAKASPAFTSRTPRFVLDKATPGKDSPGVGLYKAEDTIKTPSASRPSSAFASSAARCTPDRLESKGKDAPPPGSYDINTSLKFKEKSSHGGGASWSKDRTQREKLEKTSLAPGPGAYVSTTQDSIGNSMLKNKPSAVFATNAKRGILEPRGKDSPAPGSYEVDASLKYKERTSSGAVSWSRDRSQREKLERTTLAPGPGAYSEKASGFGKDWTSPSSKPSAAFADSSRRADVENKSFSPGPGAYEGTKGFADKNASVRRSSTTRL